MVEKIITFWRSFEGSLSYVNKSNEKEDIELIIKDDKNNISAILGEELIINDKDKFIIVNN